MLGLPSRPTLMLTSHFIATLRNIRRNKLYTAINLFGLSTAFCSTLLIFLYVRQEMSFDAWLPEAEKTYLLVGEQTQPGRPPATYARVPPELANLMKADFPEIAAIARLKKDGVSVRHASVDSIPDNFYWADADFFSLLKLSTVAGDLTAALQQPDGIVISRSMARKYFGKDAPLGGTLEIDRTHAMKVAAVIEDLPPNSNLHLDIIASGKAAHSKLTAIDARPACAECYLGEVYTYLRLKPGASSKRLDQEMPGFLSRHKQTSPAGIKFRFFLLPLPQLHLTSALSDMDGIGNSTALYALSGIGCLIVLIAGINFVNLMTARAGKRAMEIGIRKAVGASRRDLIAQFLSESLLYVAVSLILATSISELLLPYLSAALDRKIDFDYWRHPLLVLLILATAAGIGSVAGFYPAVVLSSFRPQDALRKNATPVSGMLNVRGILVVIQFSILITLIVATAVIYRQTVYATTEAMRMEIDQVLLVDDACPGAFQQQLARLQGVKAAACSGYGALNFGEQNVPMLARDGAKVNIAQAPIDVGFLEFYGLRPVAGRVFSSARDDRLTTDNMSIPAAVVINEAAAQRLGYTSAAEAIGKSSAREQVDRSFPLEIIGVVPDFALDAIHKPIAPTAYFIDKAQLGVLSVRLNGREIPETLRAIDGLWTKLGNVPRPIERLFLEQRVQSLYVDVTDQSRLLAAFSAVALIIACSGLFGLSAFSTERRIKEIGVRKAAGAGTLQVMRLLAWQFTRPVLLANLIAWPVAGLIMNRWLHGFAYHIALSPWLFVSATGLALLVALFTVSVHCYLVARAKPVVALRYE